ncbi:conjugal transfer pilus assembly protein TraU, partial [Escherichia coli]|uniref:conjugal transfer pilus assembly protein TraU n=1 Tax=Escherichia coli TaxID=562 RepID=UPI0032E928EF
PAYGPQNDVTLKMPAFEWVHVQLHQQKGMISLSPPTICNSALNPEAVIFANPIAQGACAADAIASAFNMPLDVLFWCAGSQGSMYPFNGWVSNESSPLQSSLLVSERMAFKLHRQGMIMETIGKNNAVCNEYPSPILPKERWRYQMVNMYPDSGQCHPFGRSVTRWETGKNPPNTKKNFGYLMWRKRNCVFL